MALAMFRCDAGPSIGAGHAMRCLAAAETLAWASWKVAFVSSAETAATVPAIAHAGIPTIEAAPDALSGADVVVFDHYGIDAAAEARSAAGVALRIAFDDAPARDHAVDVLVDPTPKRKPEDYAARIPRQARALTGAHYAQLRRSWLAQRGAGLARRAADNPVRRILVSMGATDPANATGKILAALALANLDADIDVVLGQGAPHRHEVERALGPRARLHIDPDLPRFAVEADFAIGAAGSSGFERACVGLPALIVVVADNQNDLAAAFAADGAAQLVSRATLGNPAALARTIAAFAADGAARRAMSQAGAAMVDGRGTQRLLLAIAGETEAAAGKVRLRLADASDEAWLLDLQQKPETRRFAISPRAPTAAEHASWYARTLAGADRLLAIAECGGAACGMIRIDAMGQRKPAFEVSIAVAPEWHGRGVASACLSLLRRFVPQADLYATVLADNTASRALFARAGYRPESETRYRQSVA